MVLGMLSSAWGLQLRTVGDNERVTVPIAAHDKTRVAVLGDRIARVQGTEGAYRSRHDAVNGEIYIVPTPGSALKSFVLFITTERGQHYTVQCQPQDRTADSVVLKPGRNPLQARQWEQSTDYETTMVNLMQAMVQGVTPEGYGVAVLRDAPKQRLRPGLTVQLQTIYRGLHQQGQIWVVQQRRGRAADALRAEAFYRAGTRALALVPREDPIGHALGDKRYTLYTVMYHE